jgi:hypothetical protein
VRESRKEERMKVVRVEEKDIESGIGPHGW